MISYGGAGTGKSIEDHGLSTESSTETRTILGQSIRENQVPGRTATAEQNPLTVWKDTLNQLVFGISQDHLSTGLLAVSAPGGGKTNLFRMLLPPLYGSMKEGDVLAIFDTKGDYLREFGNQIPADVRYIIGNQAEYEAVTRYPNLFAEIMPRGSDGRLLYTKESDTDALEISVALFDQMPSESQPAFPSMAGQLLCAGMIALIRKYWKKDPSRLNNETLLHFFASRTSKELIDILNEPGMEDQRSCLSFISGTGNMALGVMAYLTTVLKRNLIGPFAKADPAREFSMRDLVEGHKKVVVFIEYDLRRGNTLRPMYGLLLDQVLKHGLGGRTAENERSKLYLLIDEWALLPKIEHMSEALSFGRSQQVKVIAGLQNISAIESRYGEEEAENIMAGFQNLVCFKLTDRKTREWMTDRLGKNYQNISLPAQNDSVNVQRDGHCLEDWDLQELDLTLGKAVVKLNGERPFLFHFPEARPQQSNFPEARPQQSKFRRKQEGERRCQTEQQ